MLFYLILYESLIFNLIHKQCCGDRWFMQVYELHSTAGRIFSCCAINFIKCRRRTFYRIELASVCTRPGSHDLMVWRVFLFLRYKLRQGIVRRLLFVTKIKVNFSNDRQLKHYGRSTLWCHGLLFVAGNRLTVWCLFLWRRFSLLCYLLLFRMPPLVRP